MTRAAVGLSIAVIVLTGCAPSVTGPSSSPVGLEVPATIDGLAGEHAGWVLSEALGARAPSREELADRFAGTLLDDASGLTAVLDHVRADGPWEVTSARSTGRGQSAEVVLQSARGVHLVMHTTVDEQGRALLFWFGPAVDPSLDPSDPGDRARILHSVPAHSALAVGRAQDGRCVDLTTEGSVSDGLMPLASVSKLVVLDAVLEQVDAGALTWDQPLTLEQHHRSLPAGDLALKPPGTTLTVEDAVLALLADSDNTAADLLLAHLGADTVHDAYVRLAPDHTGQPFWSTREVFALGWGTDRIHGSVELLDLMELRAVVASRPLTTTVFDVTVARWQDGLDWYLTPSQTCDLGARLHAQWGAVPGPIRSALADGAVLMRKPGGAPGVVTGLWLVSGRRGPHVVTVQFAAEQQTAVGDTAGLMALGDALAAQASG